MLNKLILLRPALPPKTALCSSYQKVLSFITTYPNVSTNFQTHTSTQQEETTPSTAHTNFVQVLKNYGFDESDSLKIISKDPQVLTITPVDLDKVLDRWHHTKLGIEYVNLLILNNPLVLYASTVLVEKRLPLLHAYVKKPKQLLLLLLRCPNLLTEQWEQIQAKIDYLDQEMRVDRAEILQSGALNKTLYHIKLRHNLLLKCGMYRTPSQYEHKKNKAEKAAYRNPHLKRIVDNEDVSFARKICRISVEEYDAFSQVFQDEMDAFDREEYESGSDSDDDS